MDKYGKPFMLFMQLNLMLDIYMFSSLNKGSISSHKKHSMQSMLPMLVEFKLFLMIQSSP